MRSTAIAAGSRQGRDPLGARCGASQSGDAKGGASPIPFFLNTLNPTPTELALKELREDPEAVALASIARIAKPYEGSNHYALADCFALASDKLSDLIFDAALSHDLGREELPSIGEVVDLLAGDLGVAASSGRRSGSLRAEPVPVSGLRQPAANAGGSRG